MRSAALPAYRAGDRSDARELVGAGLAKSTQAAFDRFLGRGTAGHVPQDWPSVEATVAVITGAGGHAVLAHPPGRVGQDLVIGAGFLPRDAPLLQHEAQASSHERENGRGQGHAGDSRLQWRVV